MKTPLARAIAVCGGQAALAKAIGVRQQVVWNWIQRGGRVPSDRCARIEAATGVRRWDLRPDDWNVIWPELVGAEGAPEVHALQSETPGTPAHPQSGGDGDRSGGAAVSSASVATTEVAGGGDRLAA